MKPLQLMVLTTMILTRGLFELLKVMSVLFMPSRDLFVSFVPANVLVLQEHRLA